MDTEPRTGASGLPVPNVFDRACPSRAVLDRLSGKWTLLVVAALAEGPVRNNALLRRVDGISQKMLTETLGELVALNLVTRHSRATVPPHVDYALTPLGRDLLPLIRSFDRWVEEHFYDMVPPAAPADGAPGG